MLFGNHFISKCNEAEDTRESERIHRDKVVVSAKASPEVFSNLKNREHIKKNEEKYNQTPRTNLKYE